MRILQATLAVLYLFSFPATSQEIIDEGRYKQSAKLIDEGWFHLTGSDFEVGVEKFSKAIEIYNGNADAFVGRANALMKLERLEEAEIDIEKALSMSGDESDMYYLAGNIYFKMGYYEKATSNYSKAIQFHDQSDIPVDLVNCYYNRGNANFEAGMYRSAINDFSKAILEDKDFMNAYHNRALAYKHRGAISEACTDFKKAKELGSLSSEQYIQKFCQ